MPNQSSTIGIRSGTGMMGANAGAAGYLEPATPRRGMDLSLYIEAELERQQLRAEVARLEAGIDQIKEYLAGQATSPE